MVRVCDSALEPTQASGFRTFEVCLHGDNCVLWMLFPLGVPTKCGNSGLPESYPCRGTVGSLVENCSTGQVRTHKGVKMGWKQLKGVEKNN